MREMESRSRRSYRSKSRDRDRDYYSRSKRSKSSSKQSKSKKKKSKKRYRRSSSSSSGTSKNSTRSRGSIKSGGSSVSRATKPHISADNFSSTKAPKDNYRIDITDSMTIEQIESDSFTAKPFNSADNKQIAEKVIIDLKSDTISVEVTARDPKPEESLIFHPNFLGDDMRKLEKWTKKLYNYRQKAFED